MIFRTSLNIGVWNIHGLFSKINNIRYCKLDDPEISKRIADFDVFCSGGGHAVGTGHLWQLVRGGGSPEKMDLHLVQKVLSAKRVVSAKVKTPHLVKMILSAYQY